MPRKNKMCSKKLKFYNNTTRGFRHAPPRAKSKSYYKTMRTRRENKKKYGSPTSTIVQNTNKVLPSIIRKRDRSTIENHFS